MAVTNDKNNSPIFTKPTISDLCGEFLSRNEMEAIPIRNPKVCDDASRYPAEDPSSIGNAISDAYDMSMEGRGMRKNPTIPPRKMI